MFHFHFLYVSQYFRTIHIVCVEDLLGGGRGGAGRLTPCFLFPFSLPNTFARHISCACDSLLGGVPILLCNCIPPPPKCAFRGSAPCFLRISLFVGVPILLHSTHCGFRVVLKATFSSIDTSCVCVPILFAQPFHCQAARQPRRSGVSMQEVRVRLHPAGLVKSRGRTQPPFCVQWKHSRSLVWKRARSNAIHRCTPRPPEGKTLSYRNGVRSLSKETKTQPNYFEESKVQSGVSKSGFKDGLGFRVRVRVCPGVAFCVCVVLVETPKGTLNTFLPSIHT